MQERQTQFSLQALRWLAVHHNASSQPKQYRRYKRDRRYGQDRQPGVVLIGHSMGGVVARAVMLDAAGDPALGEVLVGLEFIRPQTPSSIH